MKKLLLLVCFALLLGVTNVWTNRIKNCRNMYYCYAEPGASGNFGGFAYLHMEYNNCNYESRVAGSVVTLVTGKVIASAIARYYRTTLRTIQALFPGPRAFRGKLQSPLL